MIFADQIEAVLRAVRFLSPGTYSWFGETSAKPSSTMSDDVQRQWVLSSLRWQLYSGFFCVGRPIAATARENHVGYVASSDFVEKLSEANCGRGCPSSDWIVTAQAGGELMLQKNGLTLSARVQDCDGIIDAAIEIGQRITLNFPKELRSASPGFYVASADKELRQSAAEPLTRVYWNLKPSGAIGIMRRVTRELNEAGIPFKFKVLSDPAHFTRCDAAVLYFRKSDYRQVARALESIYPVFARCL
jgi:hypothetical protein